jgi:hypothetical protein
MTAYLIPVAYFVSTVLIAACAVAHARHLKRNRAEARHELYESLAHVVSSAFIAAAYAVNVPAHH